MYKGTKEYEQGRGCGAGRLCIAATAVAGRELGGADRVAAAAR